MFRTRARGTNTPMLSMSIVLPRTNWWKCYICDEWMNSQTHLDYHYTTPAHHFKILEMCGCEMIWCHLCKCWVLQTQAEHAISATHRAFNPLPQYGYLGVTKQPRTLFITPEQRGQIFTEATTAFYRYHREVHYGWFEDDGPVYSEGDESGPEELYEY